MGWLIERWGIAALGNEPDFKQIARSGQALDVYAAFKKLTEQGMEKMTPDEWRIVREAKEKMERADG